MPKNDCDGGKFEGRPTITELQLISLQQLNCKTVSSSYRNNIMIILFITIIIIIVVVETIYFIVICTRDVGIIFEIELFNGISYIYTRCTHRIFSYCLRLYLLCTRFMCRYSKVV